jgi:hypothetical protein
MWPHLLLLQDANTRTKLTIGLLKQILGQKICLVLIMSRRRPPAMPQHLHFQYTSQRVLQHLVIISHKDLYAEYIKIV